MKAWRGNVKARHFVLALRDYYFEKLTSETQGVSVVSTTSINTSRHPDAWAIKFMDVIRLQPISEAFDDDASGFITITEMNRFTSSRPIEWRSVSRYQRRISSHDIQFTPLGSFLGSW